MKRNRQKFGKIMILVFFFFFVWLCWEVFTEGDKAVERDFGWGSSRERARQRIRGLGVFPLAPSPLPFHRWGLGFIEGKFKRVSLG